MAEAAVPPITKKSPPDYIRKSGTINNYLLDFHNKILLKRISSAKAIVNTKQIVYLKHTKPYKDKMLAREIERQNAVMARKLNEIYGRKRQN